MHPISEANTIVEQNISVQEFKTIIWQTDLNNLVRLRIKNPPFMFEDFNELIERLPHTQLERLELPFDCDSPNPLNTAHPLNRFNPRYQHGLGFVNKQHHGNLLNRLAEVLPFTQLQHLDLTGHQIGDEGAKAIAKALPDSQLTEIILPWNAIYISGFNALFCAAYLCQQLYGRTVRLVIIEEDREQSWLCRSPVSKRLPLHLLDIIPQIPHQPHTPLELHGLKDDDIDTVLELLIKVFDYTQELKLINHELNDAGLIKLISQLYLTSLSTLSIRQEKKVSGSDSERVLANPLSPSVIEKLMQILPHTRITTLDLTGNQIGDVGARVLAATLSQTRLTRLTLANNHIQEAGYRALLDTVPHTQLTELTFDEHYNNWRKPLVREHALPSGAKALIANQARGKAFIQAAQANNVATLKQQLDGQPALVDYQDDENKRAFDHVTEQDSNDDTVIALTNPQNWYATQRAKALDRQVKDSVASGLVPPLPATIIQQIVSYDQGDFIHHHDIWLGDAATSQAQRVEFLHTVLRHDAEQHSDWQRSRLKHPANQAVINSHDVDGYTLLHHIVKLAAADSRYINTLELLLTAGADPRLSNHDDTHVQSGIDPRQDKQITALITQYRDVHNGIDQYFDNNIGTAITIFNQVLQQNSHNTLASTYLHLCYAARDQKDIDLTQHPLFIQSVSQIAQQIMQRELDNFNRIIADEKSDSVELEHKFTTYLNSMEDEWNQRFERANEKLHQLREINQRITTQDAQLTNLTDVTLELDTKLDIIKKLLIKQQAASENRHALYKKVAENKQGSNLEPLQQFYDNIVRKLIGLFQAYRVLASSKIQRAQTIIDHTLGIAGKIGFSGHDTTIVIMMAQYLYNRQQINTSQTMSSYYLTSADLDTMALEIAYLLTQRYELQIRWMTAEGINNFVEALIGRIDRALKGLVQKDKYKQLFAQYSFNDALIQAISIVDQKQGRWAVGGHGQDVAIATIFPHWAWNDCELVKQAGIYAIDTQQYYSFDISKTEQYGYRLGTDEEAKRLGFRMGKPDVFNDADNPAYGADSRDDARFNVPESQQDPMYQRVLIRSTTTINL